jgi:UPF0271 protein
MDRENRRHLSLNADLGESFGAWQMGDDRQILPLVTTANVACGFHAGDPLVMRHSLRLARQHGVSIGAHPSFPDLQGFGRRKMTIQPDELEAIILYQIGALSGLARAEKIEVTHVKPHGALSNMACADIIIAETVARAVRAHDSQLILLAPALSPLAAAGLAAGLRVVTEIFADRAYLDDGQLMPRNRAGAVIHDPVMAEAHVASMLREGAIISHSGKRLPTSIGSVCVHGDGAEAVEMARHLRRSLEQQAYQLVGLPSLFL